MNPEKMPQENEQLEREEQEYGYEKGASLKKALEITPEEDEQITLEKRIAEADDRERDIANGWEPGY